MRYELHIQGNPPARFHTEHEVLEAVGKVLKHDRAARIQVIDLADGQPAAFSDRRFSHEEYTKRLSL